MIYVILLEPVTPGNIGAIARAMKNFDFTKLVLINPQCDHLSTEARNRAKHAQEILETAEVYEFFVVDDYDYLIATTAILGTDYNIVRSPLTPHELAQKLKEISVKGMSSEKKIGLVIGREGHGMFNEEIEKCDFVVTVPSSKDHPTLNVSHATTILLYEIFNALSDTNVLSHINPIGKPEKDQIMKMFNQIFDDIEWVTGEKKETQQILWKKIIGKAMLTRREAYGVMGFLRKIMRNSSNLQEEEKAAKKAKTVNKPKITRPKKKTLQKKPKSKKKPVRK